jgi:hypothetical protein
MKNLIKKILKEQTEGSENKPLSEKEIRLFKYLNKHKQDNPTQDKLLDLIKTMMPMIGRNTTDARFYYEVYTANYRPEGDYENLDGSNFVDYRGFKQRRTPNNDAYSYTSGKIPFKGSNLEGYWDVNTKNQWYYVVKSYDWYPIYLFINNQWYVVSNSYSSSTSKQISHSNPRRGGYDNNIKDEVITVTPDEMKSLINGKPLDEVKTNRVTQFMNTLGKDINMVHPSRMISMGWGNDKKKVKFTIKNVEGRNGKIHITIRIDKAGTVEGTNKMVVNPEGYVVPSPFSEDIEKGIEQRLLSDYSIYLNGDNTKFKFYHPKNNG